jgi:hypothetical protein
MALSILPAQLHKIRDSTSSAGLPGGREAARAFSMLAVDLIDAPARASSSDRRRSLAQQVPKDEKPAIGGGPRQALLWRPATTRISPSSYTIRYGERIGRYNSSR